MSVILSWVVYIASLLLWRRLSLHVACGTSSLQNIGIVAGMIKVPCTNDEQLWEGLYYPVSLCLTYGSPHHSLCVPCCNTLATALAASHLQMGAA